MVRRIELTSWLMRKSTRPNPNFRVGDLGRSNSRLLPISHLIRLTGYSIIRCVLLNYLRVIVAEVNTKYKCLAWYPCCTKETAGSQGLVHPRALLRLRILSAGQYQRAHASHRLHVTGSNYARVPIARVTAHIFATILGQAGVTSENGPPGGYL